MNAPRPPQSRGFGRHRIISGFAVPLRSMRIGGDTAPSFCIRWRHECGHTHFYHMLLGVVDGRVARCDFSGFLSAAEQGEDEPRLSRHRTRAGTGHPN